MSEEQSGYNAMTISYELAKHLKDEGWPQTPGEYLNPQGYSVMLAESFGLEPSLCRVPSLDELVEAFGEKAFTLMRYSGNRREWLFAADIGIFSMCGSSAREAMVKLWLGMRNWAPFKEMPELLTRDPTSEEQSEWWKTVADK